jgi:hypothetical protein
MQKEFKFKEKRKTQERKVIDTNNSVIESLRGSSFLVFLLITSVIVQGFHSFYVFKELSNFESYEIQFITSIFYAFVLSSSILFYTLRGNKEVAISFAIFETGINLFYFLVIGKQIGYNMIMSIGISIILPVSTYFYSEETMKKIKVNKK